MESRRAQTSNSPKSPVVYAKQSKKSWVEFQLLDEQGKPVANMSYEAKNYPEGSSLGQPLTGKSDADGIIRLENLYPVGIRLSITADELAKEMEKRPLRLNRNNDTSEVKKAAEQQGYEYQYISIGQLCNALPSLAKPQEAERQPSKFHFPDDKFSGLKVNRLDCRHVLEICPFRAWVLVLHHQEDYSLVNAYNLGILADLAYNTLPNERKGSVFDFLFVQCQDLSTLPVLADGGENYHAVVEDVPFRQRYKGFSKVDAEGSLLEHDTQLFYVFNETQIIVAWRGTQGGRDWLTDFTFRPVSCPPYLSPKGKIHDGFLGAFETAKKSFTEDFKVIISESAKKKLFICGHSLGGALGLIHAASLRHNNPNLYTYGMPRVFSGEAISNLSDVVHYRHVNDSDTVTSVPPDVNLDNWLHELYGPIGLTLGYAWSAIALAPQKIVGLKLGDCF